MIYHFHQSVQKLRVRISANHFSAPEEQAAITPSGDAEVRFPRFARTVHDAAHNCYRDITVEAAYTCFNIICK